MVDDASVIPRSVVLAMRNLQENAGERLLYPSISNANDNTNMMKNIAKNTFAIRAESTMLVKPNTADISAITRNKIVQNIAHLPAGGSLWFSQGDPGCPRHAPEA